MGQLKQIGQTAEILVFPGNGSRFEIRQIYRFSARDRIVALHWAEQISAAGFSKMVFEKPGPGSTEATGEFLLVYGRDSGWASWGIGCGEDGLTLWKSACGTTIGIFATMREALDRLEKLRPEG